MGLSKGANRGENGISREIKTVEEANKANVTLVMWYSAHIQNTFAEIHPFISSSILLTFTECLLCARLHDNEM